MSTNSRNASTEASKEAFQQNKLTDSDSQMVGRDPALGHESK